MNEKRDALMKRDADGKKAASEAIREQKRAESEARSSVMAKKAEEAMVAEKESRSSARQARQPSPICVCFACAVVIVLSVGGVLCVRRCTCMCACA